MVEVVGDMSRTQRHPSLGRWTVTVHVCLMIVTVVFVFCLPTVDFIGYVRLGVVFAQVQLCLAWILLGSSETLRGFAGLLLVALFPMTPEVVCPSVVWVIPLIIVRLEDMRVHLFPAGSVPPSESLQFSTWQLMAAVSVAAVLFGLGQISLTREMIDASDPNTVRIAFALIGKAVVMTACAVVVLTLPLGSIWTVLSPGRVLPRLATITVVWLIGTALIVHFSGAVLHDWAEPVGIMTIGTSCQLATLAIVRRDGYRFVDGSMVRRLAIETADVST